MDNKEVADEVFRPRSGIFTSCRDCVFAEYEDRVQTGCRADRLSRYGSRPGIAIEDVVDPAGEVTFKVIDGGLCRYKRTSPWAGTPDEAKEENRKNVRLRLFVIAGGDVSTIAETLSSTEAGFDTVSVVPGENPPKRSDISAWLRGNLSSPWTVEWWLGEKKTPEQIVDDAVLSCRSNFYVVAKAGIILPRQLAKQIRSAIVDHEKFFLALEGYGWYCVQTFAHRQAGGNAPAEIEGGERVDSVLDKLSHIAAERGEQYVFPAGSVLC